MQGHWINNQRVKGDAEKTIAVHNPATEEVLDRVPDGTRSDALAAVGAAQAAFDGWRRAIRWSSSPRE